MAILNKFLPNTDGPDAMDTMNAVLDAILALKASVPPLASFGTATVEQTEGNSGTTTFVFPVTLNKVWASDIVFEYVTAATGSNPADATDFVGGAFPRGLVAIPAGSTTANVSIPVAGDATIEPNENFAVRLYRVAASSLGTILNDDIVPDGYDVIVLAGQSNMVGRNGPVDSTLDATDARIFQYGFDSQTVTVASNPLDHQDEGTNTVGMGLSLAKSHLATMPSNRKILLVPCARGGTAFNTGFWRAGGGGDAPAIARVNAAMTQGTGTNRLVMIAWHQGESDQTLTQAQYETELDTLISRWRSSMTGASATTPFIVGQLLIGGAQTGAGVSAALAATPTRVSYTGFAASTGFASGGDNLHITAANQRTFGPRYYTEYGAAQSRPATKSVPGAMTISAVSGDASVVLSIPAGSTGTNGGYAIQSYDIYRGTASGALTLFASSQPMPYTATGLANSQAYFFQVRAKNAQGTGAFSNEVTATPVGAAGGTNLVAAPQNFGSWAPGSEVTVTNDVAANPVGAAVNADRITQVANSSAHGLTSPATGSGTLTSGATYTFAVDVKPETQSLIQIQFGSAVNVGHVNFDLSGSGVITGQGNPALTSGAVSSLGGGWFRCSVTFPANSAAYFVAKLNLIVSGTIARNSTETVASGSEKSLLVANAQCVAGSVANAI